MIHETANRAKAKIVHDLGGVEEAILSGHAKTLEAYAGLVGQRYAFLRAIGHIEQASKEMEQG